jgi:hypothetical protein
MIALKRREASPPDHHLIAARTARTVGSVIEAGADRCVPPTWWEVARPKLRVLKVGRWLTSH